MRSIVRTWAAWLGLAAACTALAAAGQELPARVGRVAYVEGSVSLFQDPEFGWDAAALNSPVTTQNSLWTDASSRAEVRVGALALRLDELTQLDIAHLDDDGIEAGIARGGLAIRVRHYDGHEGYRFYTPQAQFRLVADGRYRIDSDPERGSTRLTVLAGSAVLESTQGDVRVTAGKAIVVGDGLYAFEAARAGDLDRWADARDANWVERNVTRYVPTDITGYEELDRYGSWVNDPSYGALWMPTSVAADWVPYRDGHWAWVRPWGWTWIDEAPWGYAPFHYGRWVQARGRWAWYPGRRVEHQAWAPALVGWIGGANFSVTVRSGGSAPALGWYPLAPDERFQPWYQANTTYVNRVNVNVRNDDRNRDRRDRNAPAPRDWNREHGATVVARDTLLRQRPVAQNVVSVTPQVVRQHQSVPQPSSVLPSRNELARERPTQARPAQAAPSSGTREQRGATATAAPPANPFARGERPQQQRPSQARPGQQPVPRPAPPGSPAPAAQASPAPQSAPAAPANPFARQPQPQQQQQQQQQQQERAAREQQQRGAEQQRQQRAAEQQHQQQQQQQAQQRAAEQQHQQQQQAQQRAAEQQHQQQQAAEQQRQQQQQTQQRAAEQQRQQQQQTQQRAAEQQHQQQQQAQQRAAEQQRQQQQQAAEQQRQQQQQAQQRAAEQQRQQQQQAQQRAAEQQRQQQQQQQAQQRAAEQQRQQQQQAQQRAAEQQRQQQQQAQQRAAEQQRQQQQAAERQQREQAKPPQPPHAAPPHPPEKPEQEPRGKEKDDHGSGG